jgi:hypothetical protein
MITHPKKYTATLETIQMIYKEEELPALYRGLSFTLLGTTEKCGSNMQASFSMDLQLSQLFVSSVPFGKNRGIKCPFGKICSLALWGWSSQRFI